MKGPMDLLTDVSPKPAYFSAMLLFSKSSKDAAPMDNFIFLLVIRQARDRTLFMCSVSRAS